MPDVGAIIVEGKDMLLDVLSAAQETHVRFVPKPPRSKPPAGGAVHTSTGSASILIGYLAKGKNGFFVSIFRVYGS